MKSTDLAAGDGKTDENGMHHGSLKGGPSKDKRQAAEEREANSLSKPGGFDNDPDDASNPNEVRERHLRKLRR